ASAEQIPKVLNGLGVALVSTSKGILTDAQARLSQVGGEVLAYIW
ncbi:MAG: 30S ribosomal protein S8, partial ['Prunus persica' phytoplasma PP2]|nr:30S ribosomal protein S8 ['Prunus persica' phytoplasma PP2]